MKRVFVMLVAGTALSGAAALYATSTAQAVEPTKPQDRASR
ncbi:hypothetical protein [Sphingomonas turrisvirgatae]|nr:hypothetical protein [Sphingomonas turrisvirgatae]